MSEWQKYKLGDILSVKHGYAFKGEYFSEIPTLDILLTPGNFNIGGGFRQGKLKYYNGDYPPSFVLNEGDVIVTMTDLSKEGDTLGYSAKIPKHDGFRYLHNQRIGLLQFLSDGFSKDFIYWVLRSREYQKFIVNSATGSTVKHTSPSRICEYTFTSPDFPTQSAIAEILSSLDDKIELNNKINQELENLAQNLFKRWFIDFEFPNENGEPYKSSGGEMVDSELGEIPKGWEVKTFADVASVIDCLHSKKPQILESPTGYRYIQLSNIKDNGLMDLSNQYWITKEDYEKWISRIEVREGDFVITNVGRSGAVSRIPSDVRAAIGRNMTAIRLNEDFNFIGYFSTLVVSDFMKNEITSKLDSGTILDALNVKNIPKLRFMLPAKINTIQVFEDVVKILWEKMEMNIKENNYLKSIRDILLPKLISGELEVQTKLSQTT